MKFLMDFIMPPPKAPKKTTKNKCYNTNARNNNFLPSTSSDKIHFKCSNYPAKMINKLNALRLDERFCDVEIVAGDRIFKSHRAVLSASSPYFHAMFTGGLCEKDQTSVELHAISPYIMEILINFIYSGSVFINQSNVQELMVASDMLELIDIVNECTQFLIKEIHPFNAIGIFRFSDAHNFQQLKNSSLEYIESNFRLVCDEEEIYDLDKDAMIKFLESENLRVDSEFQVFQAAITWINYHIVDRRRYVFEILKHVRLPLLSLALIDRAVATCNDPSLRVALRSIHSDLQQRRGALVTLTVAPRTSSKRDIYLIGGCRREPKTAEHYPTTVQRYDVYRREWSAVVNIGMDRLVPGVAALGGDIYVAGGERDSHVLDVVERYRKDTDCWEKVAPMHVARCEFGLCALDGHLYALGGWLMGGEIGANVERYHPLSDQWHVLGGNSAGGGGGLPSARFSVGVVGWAGRLYMVGGCSQHERYLAELWSYDVGATDSHGSGGVWRRLQPMAVARSQMAVAVLEDCLYVVGGENRHQVLDSVERYSFRTGTWTTIPPMTQARSRPAVAALDGHLYVIGGATVQTDFYRCQVTLASVECYDPVGNRWQECPPLPESRAEAGAVVL